MSWAQIGLGQGVKGIVGGPAWRWWCWEQEREQESQDEWGSWNQVTSLQGIGLLERKREELMSYLGQEQMLKTSGTTMSANNGSSRFLGQLSLVAPAGYSRAGGPAVGL